MISRVINAFKRHNRFLVTAHVDVEPDALGSELALSRLLISLGKKVIVCNDVPTPCEYNFLPHLNMIKRPKDISTDEFDAAIAVDCSDLSRLGVTGKLIPREKLFLNIDHHIRNTRFAQINWVEPHASSCAELIYKIYKKLHKPIDKKVALLLYSAIVSDTGSFKYPNTTAFTHQMATDLLRWNLPINKIYQNIYENITFSQARIISEVLQGLRQDCLGKIAYFSLNKDLLNSKEGNSDLSDYILNFARAIKDVELVVFFKPAASKSQTRVSFRSKGRIDVSLLAGFFGGGGHRSASGCIINASLASAEKMVLAKARGLVRGLKK